MIINFLKTNGYTFNAVANGYEQRVSEESPVLDTRASHTVKLVQMPKKDTGDQRDIFRHFMKMLLSSPIRALFLFRKRISQEESPVFMECDLCVEKEADNASVFFNHSVYSEYDGVLTKPYFDLDSRLSVKNLHYFVCDDVVTSNKKRQLCRKYANISFLAILNILFLIYTLIEKVYNASTFSLFLFIPLILLGAFSIFKAYRRFKVYCRQVNARVTYLNEHVNDRGSSAGFGK